jgi:DNA-binding NtrC family response regulator
LTPIVPLHLVSPRLLLVDDDPILRDTVGSLLQDEGFQVRQAGSAEEAIPLLRLARPSFEFVITDLVMPGKSGMDVLEAALAQNPSCTVLILTGFGSVREATEAMDKGAFDLVTKPIQVDQFRNTLRRLLERAVLIHDRDDLRAKVKELHERIEQLEATQGRMEMLAQRIAPANSEPQGVPLLGDLERLGSLRARGLLTEDQFESAKSALLTRFKV